MAQLLTVNKEIAGIYYENFTVGIEMIESKNGLMYCDIQFVIHIGTNFPDWVKEVRGTWNTPTTWPVNRLDLEFSKTSPIAFITAKALHALGYLSYKPKPDEIEVKKFLTDEIKREEVDDSTATGCHMKWRKTSYP